MADENNFAAELGLAWAHHRQGNNDVAIREFEGLIAQSPDLIDAMYGLALSQRAAGMIGAAVATFEKTMLHINHAMDAQPGHDRTEILQRMVQQRLAELSTVAR